LTCLKIFLLEEKPKLVVGSRDHLHNLGTNGNSNTNPQKSFREGRDNNSQKSNGGAANAISALPPYRRDLEMDGLGIEAVHACFTVGKDMEAPPVVRDTHKR
jgi:hypothetical protein